MNHANNTAVIDVNAGDAIEIAHQRAEPGLWNSSYFEGCAGGRATCDGQGSLVSQSMRYLDTRKLSALGY